jgi:predicted DNA-binding transcriptional regulator AlpA
MNRDANPNTSVPDRILRWRQVQPLVGLSRSTWWRMCREQSAPAPLRLSERCVGWSEGSILAFQASRVTAASTR